MKLKAPLPSERRCACGLPLHYKHPAIRYAIEQQNTFRVQTSASPPMGVRGWYRVTTSRCMGCGA
jgi:hypothetical protein